ncbi:MAG: hypothetical protein ACJAYU_004356 [Bradymonadia bacterium]|jgi:hypothetical protein
MRSYITLAVVALFTLPAAAQAQSLTLAADFGYDRVLDHDTSGPGFNIYPGLSLGPIRAEAQVGYHHGTTDPRLFGASDLRTTYIPMMLGGRVGIPLGILYPWVGAHGGFAYVGRTTQLSSRRGALSFTNHEWEPAFNVGGGVDLCFGPASVGGALWYNSVMDPDDPMRIVSAAITVAIAL